MPYIVHLGLRYSKPSQSINRKSRLKTLKISDQEVVGTRASSSYLKSWSRSSCVTDMTCIEDSIVLELCWVKIVNSTFSSNLKYDYSTLLKLQFYIVICFPLVWWRRPPQWFSFWSSFLSVIITSPYCVLCCFGSYLFYTILVFI